VSDSDVIGHCRPSSKGGVNRFCDYGQTRGKAATPLGVLTAIQPGPRFQQIGDGDGGASPIPGKSGTGTGERPRGPLSHPGHWQIGDEGPVPVPGRPVPVPGQIGDGDAGDGDRGVRALPHCAIVKPRLYATSNAMGSLPT
jgi:hypothetical protein